MDGILLAYFGPETMLPITSVVAACAGLFMIFGQKTMQLIRRTFSARSARPIRSNGVYHPHTRRAGQPQEPAEKTQS